MLKKSVAVVTGFVSIYTELCVQIYNEMLVLSPVMRFIPYMCLKYYKLNIPPEIIREACDMVNGGESLDNMANAYEEKFTEKNAPAEETPEIEKPKPQKKPKL